LLYVLCGWNPTRLKSNHDRVLETELNGIKKI